MLPVVSSVSLFPWVSVKPKPMLLSHAGRLVTATVLVGDGAKFIGGNVLIRLSTQENLLVSSARPAGGTATARPMAARRTNFMWHCFMGEWERQLGQSR